MGESPVWCGSAGESLKGAAAMQKTILITGATDGIGLETAKMLVSLGHKVLLHGRNQVKLATVVKDVSVLAKGGQLKSYVADLSTMAGVEKLATAVADSNDSLDVLINNAGVFVASEAVTSEGLDVRFAVNTIAPYLLTKRLLHLMGTTGRVINLSSAAQASLNPKLLSGGTTTAMSAGSAYAQSKLAITMWSRDMALSLGDTGPAIIAVNPGSMLGSKMVKQAYGANGADLRIGAEILSKTALSENFADASGKYFDNDIGQFSRPHPDAMDSLKCKEVVDAMESFLATVQQ